MAQVHGGPQVAGGSNIGAYGGDIPVVSWKQPPGTMDEVQGYFSLNWNNGCDDDGDAIDVQFRDEFNNEISHDLPNSTSIAGNGASNDPDTVGVTLTHGGLGGTGGADFVVPMPIERPQFIGPNSGEASRQVKVRMRRLTGCTNAGMTLHTWHIWVIRYQAG